MKHTRHERRALAAILRHQTTSPAQRGKLREIGLPDVYKRNGAIVVPDIRVDCFDVWRRRAIAVQLVAWGSKPRRGCLKQERITHWAAYPGGTQDEKRQARNAAKRERRARA